MISKNMQADEPMSVERARLLSLIEFAQQSAKLKSNPIGDLGKHGGFSLYEHQLQGLPGITLDSGRDSENDDVWLTVERLHETNPPEVRGKILGPWIEITRGSEKEPLLKDSTDGASLIEAGSHHSSAKQYLTQEERMLPGIHPRQSISLEEYEKKSLVKTYFKTYLETVWRPWAAEEKKRKVTIKLYAQLFTLKQQIDGSINDGQIELAWGIGISVWNRSGKKLNYPLLTQLTEIALDPISAAIEVRPRQTEPRLEIEWHMAEDNPGVEGAERVAKDFFSSSAVSLSPFDRGSFESLLRGAVTHLDPAGVYWPDKASPEERHLPNPDTFLKVTDTWALFSRPRNNSVLIVDLGHLKTAVSVQKESEKLPNAVAAIVTNPSTSSVEVTLPPFRGVSMSSYGGGSSSGDGDASQKVTDLFFPLPFNDEQVRIIQLLETSDGVVVQGPPGTGKTHTIANVICHFLANGKRVLVTSMKDPALKVLHDKLPEEIKPLAISLLTSEQEGMQQFEASIRKIASEMQGLSQSEYRREIRHLEDTIDSLHAKLALTDRAISDWARKNLDRFKLGDEDIEPQDAAKEIVERTGHFEWITDKLGIEDHFHPQFSDSDIISLREARQKLGVDIDYLNQTLPRISEFSDARSLLQTHQDLTRLSILVREIDSGKIPSVDGSTSKPVEKLQALLDLYEEVLDERIAIAQTNRPWTTSIRGKFLGDKSLASNRRASGQKTSEGPIHMMETLGQELLECEEERNAFITWPVSTPPGIENDIELMEAISKLTEGKKPFGLAGLFGKTDKKNALALIAISGGRPQDPKDWQHIKQYLLLKQKMRGLAVRWNTLAPEVGLEMLAGSESEHALEALDHFKLYLRIKAIVLKESDITARAIRLFPEWNMARSVCNENAAFEDLGKTLRHHLTLTRLENAWAVKENFKKVLEGRSGRVVTQIQTFFEDSLGNPELEDAYIQSGWSALLKELVRVERLSPLLTQVDRVTTLIHDSGAPGYAGQLKAPLESANDSLLPDHWRHAWKLKRLSTYLESIDAHEKLKQLSKSRRELETDLARAYQDAVVKRTWLKLAEKASPSIRAALQAYLNAIQKIGKGTGKRAVRYRRDASSAASHANSAVPCWIMPHYRVSESLPAELGCFDLVIVDEASQSDLTALPALLRGQKVLIVGDDKQVSPEGVGLDEEKVRALMRRFLGDQVPIYQPQMSPERSIYDLYKVVFAQSGIMLKEHFRCVGPIIEYSKREFYSHELKPLRMAKTSERLDPPLVDVVIEDGYRESSLNRSEARFIVDEIKKIVSDPKMANRSIGMVSLLGDKQPLKVWEMLTEELGVEILQRHQIACGDARTFQGKERDIMFLSMVSAPNDVGAPLSRDTFAQRFNVAASRARDRMYLVRSVDLEHLSEADHLRRNLIRHFMTPFSQDENKVEDLRTLCESPFEREVYDELTQRGYWVVPQVKVGHYRIDMVVEGHNDSRLAVECDGDRYHGPDKWDDDMQRQRTLERAGWIFWRSFASNFVRKRNDVVNDLLSKLTEQGIEPIGAEGAPRSIHTEQRRVRIFSESME